MTTIIWIDGGIGEEWYIMIPGWSTHCDANHLSPMID